MFIRAGIIGRPNVGKSTLFNSLVGGSRALVGNFAGVTRDYKEEVLDLRDYKLILTDTAGLKSSLVNDQEKKLNSYTKDLIDTLDIILFIIDGREGVTIEDKEIFYYVRKLNKPTVLVVNKVETKLVEQNCTKDIYSFGLKEPIYVSGEHKIGLDTLLNVLKEYCDKVDEQGLRKEKILEDINSINIAIIGRPNVGKSTIINSIIKKERFVTGPEAGLTRDSNSVVFKWNKTYFQIYDTAGARKKRKIDTLLEKNAVKETLRAIRFAQLVVLVLEPNDLLNAQDHRLASLCDREGRALVFAVNKVDQINDRSLIEKKLRVSLINSLPQFKNAYICYVSGLHGTGLEDLRNKALATISSWNFKLTTSNLNVWLQSKVDKHSPPMNRDKRRIKMKYIVQSKTGPPTFRIFISHNGIISSAYKRYLENSFKEDFKLYGTPIRMNFKSGENPFRLGKS
ncbi:ribosome biogenesis GTPase Der [Paracoccaceae bacterium]|nr:ribosome biogenesis GTPase Der [Paracoccaceae bacterium]